MEHSRLLSAFQLSGYYYVHMIRMCCLAVKVDAVNVKIFHLPSLPPLINGPASSLVSIQAMLWINIH